MKNLSLPLESDTAAQRPLHFKASAEKLRLLEIYYNSGKGHLSFGALGEPIEKESAACFSHDEQMHIARSLLSVLLSEVQDCLHIDFEDIIQNLPQWSSSSSFQPPTSSSFLMEELSRRLGAGLRFHNKLSELEIRFSPRAIEKLRDVNREKIKEQLTRRLEADRNIFSQHTFHVVTGVDYCKVSLFDKSSTVKKILKTLSGGSVLALGDSPVDISFLALRPRGVCYRAWYLGKTQEIETHKTIKSPELKGVKGTSLLIRESLERHAMGVESLSAIIADIDNCLVDSHKPMNKEITLLLKRALEQNVSVFLITDEHIRNRYYERVIDKFTNRVY